MHSTRLAVFAAAISVLAVAASSAAAAPVVRQAAGADTASIQAAVDQFNADLGALNAGPPQPSGRRQIVWDGVPDERAAPSFMPENQFRGAGALFQTPGVGFQVSGDTTLDFSETNATYTTAFEPFSAPRLFTASGSNLTTTTFVVPGTNTGAQTNGFGVVFSDVDLAGSTSIELVASNGASLGSFAVPAAGNSNATFSFLGVSFNAGERIASAIITSGAAPLSGPSPTGDDITQGGPADLVVMDNFIFGEPQATPPPPPPPPPDTARPTVTLRGAPASIRLRVLLRRGVRVRLTPNEPASFRVSLLGSVRNVRIARNELTLASRSLGRAAGTRTVRLRPARKLLRSTPRRFRLRLAVTATDAAGNARTVRRTIRVRR